MPMVWLCNKLSTAAGIDAQLRSDSIGQLLAIGLLWITSIGINRTKGIFNSAYLWNWAPYVLVSGQMWLYGAVKLAGVQFVPLPDLVENSSEELEFWRMAGNMGVPVIITGCTQIAIAVGLLIPKLSRWAAWIALLCFIVILGLNFYFEISVKVHAAVLLATSAYLVCFKQLPIKLSRAEAVILSIILAGLFAEGLYYFL
jgi:hypothetical protein